AGQPDRPGDVVDGRFRFEAVEEPHPLLRERQRDPLGTFLCDERRAALGLALLDAGGESGYAGRLEQDTNGHNGSQFGTEARDDLRRDERVAAEGEEVVVEP